jgi:hypothetical protein
MNGIAEEDAMLGDRIRIRILKPLSTFSDTGATNIGEILFGIVRGKRNAEIEP